MASQSAWQSGAESSGAASGSGAEPGPRLCGLASARDRARLRERQAAERARVERVLARGPRETASSARAVAREAGRADADRERAAASLVPAEVSPDRATCRVCRGRDVSVDQVVEWGLWRLAQCRRCDHRWTERAAEPFAPRLRRPGRHDRGAAQRAGGAAGA